MPTAAVTRLFRGFRPLPLLVGVVLLLCAGAIFAALVVPAPHPEFPLPLGSPAAPPVPPAVPRAPPAPPPVAVLRSPQLPAAPEPPTAEGFDWHELPIKPQGDLLGKRSPVGALAIRRALPRVRRCLQSWTGQEAPRLDLALGIYARETGSFIVEDVEVKGGTVYDASIEACVVAALVGVRFSVPEAAEGTRLRIGENVTLPLATHVRQTQLEE